MEYTVCIIVFIHSHTLVATNTIITTIQCTQALQDKKYLKGQSLGYLHYMQVNAVSHRIKPMSMELWALFLNPCSVLSRKVNLNTSQSQQH